MAETIKGGAYQGPDGSWHDANNKPLSSGKVQEAEELKRRQAAEARQAEQALQRQMALANGTVTVQEFRTPAGVTAVTAETPLPPFEETVEETAKPKRGKRS